MVKRMHRPSPDSPTVTLSSDNPDHPPFTLYTDDILTVYRLCFHMTLRTL
ncbi:MAG: hypothetical protein ILA34_00095 [Bacteroidaceae bacterium]|nr:hypothetical protein [Bacteroidaceae bacterium]